MDPTRRDAAQGQSYLSPVTLDKALLDFRTRHLTLGRWSLPVPRTTKSTKAHEVDTHVPVPQPTTNVEGLKYVQAHVSAMFQKSARSPTPPTARQAGQHEWAFTPDDQLVAQFGQTLFPLDSSSMGPESALAASFVPSLPGLPKILIDEDLKLGFGPGAPVFEYTFVAAPVQKSFTKGQQFPPLRVQFSYNERIGQHYLKQLHLDLDKRIHDILLPDKALDIRFIRRSQLRLHAPNTSKMVEEFMKTVIANIQSGEKLTAPSVNIDIPNWAIPGYTQAHLPGTINVEYLFTGIRFRQNVTAKILEVPVTFSTAQSGKLGSKSAALSANFEPASLQNGENATKDQHEDDLKAFVGGCFKILDKITVAAANQDWRFRAAKPRDELSARKIRRQALQAEPTDGDAVEVDAEHASSPVAEDTTEQDSAESSQQFSAPISQHLDARDMEDPYLSSLLTEETTSEQQDGLNFAPRDTISDSEEQKEGQPLKTAA